MAPRPGESAGSAGISDDGPVDVAALFERLRQEVRGAAAVAAQGGDGALRARAAARSQAERFWPVSAERPLERRPGPRGRALAPVKRSLRTLMRFYVEPLAAEQRSFNDSILKLVDALAEQVDAELAAGSEASRLAGELQERLLRLERRTASATAGTPRGNSPLPPVAPPAAGMVPDYFAFESRMRGSTAEIRERQRIYVEPFRDLAPVLDVGCGRGEFLALLRAEGVEARGVDVDPDMVAFARGERLDVEQADLVAALELVPDGGLGGIFAAQVVEHLRPDALLRLLELSHVKLRPGGLLVAETINPLAPLALRNYFADLTHAQPLVPETLALLARQSGFREVETRFLHEPAERLAPVALPPEPAFDAARAALTNNVRLLNDQIFGPLDYALFART